MRKIAKYISMIMIVASVIALNTTITKASAFFDRDACVEYAKNHYNDGKGLCSEFVSDCINAGGVDCYSVGASTLHKQLIESGMGIEYIIPLENDGRVYIGDRSGQIEEGDVVWFHCSECEYIDGCPWIHVVIAANNGGEENWLRAYSHNSANSGENIYYYDTQCYYCGADVDYVSVYHFNDNDQFEYENNVTLDFDNSSVELTCGDLSELEISFSGEGIHSIGYDLSDSSVAAFNFKNVDWSVPNAIGNITAINSGNTTLTIYLYDDYNNIITSKSISISVKGSVGSAYMSSDNITIKEGGEENLILYFDVQGGSSIYPYVENEEMINISYGTCETNCLPMTIHGNYEGTTTIEFSICDNNGNELAKAGATVNIIKQEDEITGSAYASQEKINLTVGDDSQEIELFFDMPEGSQIYPTISNEGIVDITYGVCEVNRLPISLKGLSEGETTLTYSFCDVNNNELARVNIIVNVTNKEQSNIQYDYSTSDTSYIPDWALQYIWNGALTKDYILKYFGL